MSDIICPNDTQQMVVSRRWWKIEGGVVIVIVDGAPGLEAALVALWGEDLPIQRCTVHKHRNLLGDAPKHMHDELTVDYRDMIYAETAVEVEARRKACLRKWRLKSRAVADSLEEAGDRLFAFTPRSIAVEISANHERD